MNYSRRQLYAVGELLGECVTRKEGGRVIYGGGGSGGGGGQPANTTQTQTQELPEWARGYAKDTLAKTSALTDINQNPYKTYDANRIAGFSPLQQQSMTGAQNMGTAPQLDTASGLAGLAGQRAMGIGYEAGQFGNQFAAPSQYRSGQFNAQQVNAPGLQQYQMGPAQQVGTQDYTGQNVSQYMNPYMQNVVDIQQREAQRQGDIAGTQRAGQAVRSGAFGGSRAGLMEAEAARNLATQKSDIQAQGQNAAFQNAQQQFNQQQQANMQAQMANQGAGLQVGQQNLGAQLGVQQLGAGQNLQSQLANQQQGMTAQQLREQSRQFGAGQSMTAAQQRAQYGLSGQQLGEQSRQYGAGYGMQGLQTGLQAAGQLGQLGGQQFAQGLDINKLQAGYGAQQQALEQQGLSQSYQDFLNQQNYPYKQLGFMSDILRGTPTGSSSSMNMYQAQPGALQTATGLGLGAYGISQLMKADGGSVYEYADGGSVTSDYNTADIIDTLSDQQLQSARQNAQARKDMGTLELIDEELAQRASDRGGMSAAFNQLPPNAQENMYEVARGANGGIVAFAGGGSYRQQAAEDRETLKGLSFTAPTPEDYEKGVAARMPFIEKMYGPDTLAPYLAETKAEREKLKSGKVMDEAKGLGALMAAAELFAAPNMNQGAAGAIKAFTGEVARVKKDNKEAERLLRSSEIQLATAAQARKEGLTGKAMTAQDKADGQAMDAQKLKAGVQEKVAQLSGGLAQAELSGESQVRAAQINKEAGATADRQIAALAAQIREKDSTLSPAEVNARATKEYLNLSGRYPGADRMALEQDKMRTKRLDDATEAWGDASMDPAFRKKFNDLKKADSDRADAFKKAWIADHMAMADAKPAQGAPTQGAPTPTPAPVRGAPATQGASLPQAALSQLKEGQQTKFANGQTWTLQNGQPVQVQVK